MIVNVETLIKAGVGPTQAKVFAPFLDMVCVRFEINTTNRVCAFLSQGMHESLLFTRLEENLFYTNPERVARIFRTGFDLDRDKVVDPEEIEFARGYVRNPKALANRAYANRMGNGDEASGDGWKYRGRGIFQLTGRSNYAAIQERLGYPYLDNPDKVGTPEHACLTAGQFWADACCNVFADNGDLTGITRVINGPALLGLGERADLFIKVSEAFA